jgi:hypothetical protein
MIFISLFVEYLYVGDVRWQGVSVKALMPEVLNFKVPYVTSFP